MEKKIICLAGEMASGKGAITEYIKDKYSGESYKFSDAFRKMLDVLHIEHNRENISNLSLHIRKAFGEDVLSRALAEDIKNSSASVIAIDGMRRIEEIEELKKQKGFKLVYVEAGINNRYKRLVKRGENSGDSSKTFEEFESDHKRNADSKIKDLKSEATVIINNDGTLKDLYKQIDTLLV
jgi:dephospho-CoA kinase